MGSMKRAFKGCSIIFAGIVGFIFLSTIMISVTYRVLNYDEVVRREENLRSEFQAIIHPEGAKQLKFEVNSKIIIRWIDAEYKYNSMDNSQVEQYYFEELTKQGWLKQSVSEDAYKQFRQSIYKKGDYEIVFSPVKDYWIISLYYRDIFDRLGL